MAATHHNFPKKVGPRKIRQKPGVPKEFASVDNAGYEQDSKTDDAAGLMLRVIRLPK